VDGNRRLTREEFIHEVRPAGGDLLLLPPPPPQTNAPALPALPAFLLGTHLPTCPSARRDAHVAALLCSAVVLCCVQFGEEAAEKFDALDANHDGVVDATEWADGVDIKMKKNRGQKGRGLR
jgi:hypothetical protein